MININDKSDKQLGHVNVNLTHAKCNLHDFFFDMSFHTFHMWNINTRACIGFFTCKTSENCNFFM